MLERSDSVKEFKDGQVVTTARIHNFLGGLDWQRFVNILDDYYQAIRLTDECELEDGIVSAELGINLIEVLVADGQGIMNRMCLAAEDKSQPEQARVSAVVPNRLPCLTSLAHWLEDDIFNFWMVPQYGLPDKTGRLLNDEYGWFSAYSDFNEISTKWKREFDIQVKEIGFVFANKIHDRICRDAVEGAFRRNLENRPSWVAPA